MKSPQSISELATALEGVALLGCLPGSPSQRAGLRYGDIILEVNGRRVRDIFDYLEARELAQGELTVSAFRDGETLEVHMQLRGALPVEDVAAYLVDSRKLAS